jgi:hypothetical protein
MCCDENLETGKCQEFHRMRLHSDNNHWIVKIISLRWGLRKVGKCRLKQERGESRRIFYAGPQAWKYILT